MFLHYSDAGRTYKNYYDINSDPVPNWTSHIVMASLMTFLPPLIAEKLLTTGYVILFVCAIYYLLNAVDRRKTFYVLLGFPFIYNYLFHMGFYNFAISVPLIFIVIGYWWKRRDKFNWRMIVGLNLLLTLLYFCHLVSWVIGLMAIFILAILPRWLKIHRTFYSVLTNFAKISRPSYSFKGALEFLSLITSAESQKLKKMAEVCYRHIFGDFVKVLYLVLALIPSYLLPLYYVRSRGTARSGVWQLNQLWDYFISIGSLTSYSPNEDYIGKALAILFALLVLYTLLWNKLDLKHRHLNLQLKAHDSFFIVTLFCIVLYFRAPDGMSGGGFITTRLNLYPFLMILPWLSIDLKKPVKYAVGGIIVVLTLSHLAYTTYYYKLLNDGLAEYTSGIPFVRKNETILPLSFDHFGKSSRIGLYLHASGYYCAATGAIELDNYEGNTGYFPMTYKKEMNPFLIVGNIEGDPGNTNPTKYPEPIDNILLWSLKTEVPVLKLVKQNYRLVHQKGRLRLYKRRE